MNKWTLLVGLVLASSAVYCDFGVPVGVPNLSVGIRLAIGLGVQPVMFVKNAIHVNASVDPSGVLPVLEIIVSNVTYPLGDLLTAILRSSSNSASNVTGVFQSLENLTACTSMAIASAQKAALQLQTTILSTLYSNLTDSLKMLSNQVTDLGLALDQLMTTFQTISTAYPPYTTANISTIITPALVSSITTPLRNLSNTLVSVTVDVLSIGRDRQNAIYYSNNINITLANDNATLAQYVVAVNRTATSTLKSSIQMANIALAGITQSYTYIEASPSNYNNGNLTKLNAFLANVTALNGTAFAKVIDATNSLIGNVSSTIDKETEKVGATLYEAIQKLTNLTSISSSPFADTCLQNYAQDLTGPYASLTRFLPCIQLELGGFLPITQAATVRFSAVRTSVSSSAMRLNFCSIPNGNCTVSYFTDFDDYTVRLANGLTLATEVVSFGMYTIQGRMTDCVRAVSSDIQDVIAVVQKNYETCLTSGS
ncbi:AAEL017474-PA [Aedes aegypti]|uniref:AAEL017474-PA n=1 Tax=Aedes aegypti TaxID=7159 RepID=J9HFA3_AEDAE|nr:AAEL017474-PA [Aedes aegypti]